MPYCRYLAGAKVNGSEGARRCGAQTLLLLAGPLNAAILHALAERPKRQIELRCEVDSPAQTTLRTQLKRLTALDILEKRRRDRFPGTLDYALSEAGRDLLSVASTLNDWLMRAPEAPLRLEAGAGRAAVKALAEAWSTTMLRALATGPLSLTDLDRLIVNLNYPSLERRLAAMRLAGLVQACRESGRSTPYEVTDWLREGIGPVASAIRWERRHRPELSEPIGATDVETAFLLALPLIEVPVEVAGTCRLGVELRNGNGWHLAGLVAKIQSGAFTSGTTRMGGTPNAWALGSASAWLNALVDHDVAGLERGGDSQLAEHLIEGLHRCLFAAAQRGT